MAIRFNDSETTLLSPRQGISLRDTEKKSSDITKQISGLELRMLPPFIKENGTKPVWPFPGYARLYCLTIVVSDVNNQLAGNIDLQGFQRIGDREYLPVNKTVFYWQNDDGGKAPGQVHVFSSLMKSKKDLRDTGEIISKLKNDAAYKGLMETLSSLGKEASKINLVTGLITELATLLGKYLKDVDDKPLGTVINSYTSVYGDFDREGMSPHTYNTRNVDFNFQLVVRRSKVSSPPKKAAGTAAKKSTAKPVAKMVDMTSL